jgi:hypothetical protein
MHYLGKLSLHLEVLPLEVVHGIVIQAAEGNLMPAGFHLNLHLIKERAGERAAADGSNLSNIFAAAGPVVFEDFNPGSRIATPIPRQKRLSTGSRNLVCGFFPT